MWNCDHCRCGITLTARKKRVMLEERSSAGNVIRDVYYPASAVVVFIFFGLTFASPVPASSQANGGVSSHVASGSTTPAKVKCPLSLSDKPLTEKAQTGPETTAAAQESVTPKIASASAGPDPARGESVPDKSLATTVDYLAEDPKPAQCGVEAHRANASRKSD